MQMNTSVFNYLQRSFTHIHFLSVAACQIHDFIKMNDNTAEILVLGVCCHLYQHDHNFKLNTPTD